MAQKEEESAGSMLFDRGGAGKRATGQRLGRPASYGVRVFIRVLVSTILVAVPNLYRKQELLVCGRKK